VRHFQHFTICMSEHLLLFMDGSCNVEVGSCRPVYVTVNLLISIQNAVAVDIYPSHSFTSMSNRACE
jgi:hypothetical protein